MYLVRLLCRSNTQGHTMRRAKDIIYNQQKTTIMKKVIITLLCFTISGVAANAQDNKQPNVLSSTTQSVDPDAGKFKFKEETHDYGEVVE